MTWDAASHALIGLDIYDHLRRVEPLLLLLRLQSEHWWPPLFGLLSLPAYLLGGRQLSSPSLVSLASYSLIPALIWLSLRRITSAVPLLAWSLVALFALRSPQLIEMSTWSMLELPATLFAVAAFYCFFAGPESRGRNWAYGLAGASTLLKYHYGFFLLVTFGVATIVELDRNDRRASALQVRSRLQRPAVWISGAILVAAIIARRIAETLHPNPPIPGVPNLIWIGYIAAAVAMLIGRDDTRQLWAALPVPIRRFIDCGLIWPMIWFIDPANLQAWYRELHVQTDPPARWIDQVREIERYLTDDYFLGPAILAAAAAGLVLAIVEGVRRRRVDVLAVAFQAIWPVALMTLSKYRIESRFLSTMVAALVLSAVIGWALLLERRHVAVRLAAGVALFGVLAAEQAAPAIDWDQQLLRRRVYGYLSSDPPDRFVRATVKAFTHGQPVLIILPRDIQVVAPTVRLALRLALPDVRPDAVDVRGGDAARLAARLRHFPGGVIGAEAEPAALRRLAEQHGMRITGMARGPELPDGRRALLMVSVERVVQ